MAAIGCGSDAPPARAPEVMPAATSGNEQAEPDKPGMQVEGLLGTIPQRKIEEALQAKMPSFQRCFFEGMNDVELLAGHMKFYFRVGLDGRVEWVSPRGSSVGHRPTELCLLGVAEKTRFPAPKGGGPAEFVWGFEIENPSARPPVAWPPSKVATSIESSRASLADCELGAGRYTVTAYVAPGGTVTAVGAAADSQAAAAKIDCVVSVVKAWHMPDPGSYPAKVSFDL
ncbi:MAG TPA: AgmX/PglI C-terminal domain-containing protein [Polyangiales bacterium]